MWEIQYVKQLNKLFALILIGCLHSVAFASNGNPFLKSGEVWLRDGKKETKLTDTAGKIKTIQTSPSGRYVAANKQIGEFESHDDTIAEEQHAQKLPMYSVLIIDIKKREVLSELRAPRELTHPMNWNEGEDKYRFGEGGELEVYAVHEYDPLTNKIKQLEFNNGSGEYE